MAIITVKYDPTITHSDVIARLDNSSHDEAGEYYQRNPVEIQQTSVYGVQCPIIAVNNIMIASQDILSFRLDDTGHIPSVNLHINDRKSLIEYLDTPGADNELRIIILPPFEDVYKKINLTFFITNFRQGRDGDLYISGEYKLPTFTASQFKSLGELSTYELCDTVAKETGLGLASNVEGSEDKRFVYCPYISYKNAIEKEMTRSGSESQIYEWWIDVWNYLNFVDIYERYNTSDSEDDLRVWVSGAVDEIGEGIKIEPQEVKAELTNLFGSEESQLYIKNYRIVNNPGPNLRKGVDRVYSVYMMDGEEGKKEKGTYIGDNNAKKDIFYNYEYKGEVYGEYDYITSSMFRDVFLQKMKTYGIEVDLNQPLLGLQRGNHVIIELYYNDDSKDYPTAGLSEEGLVNLDQTTNPPLEEIGQTYVADTFKLDNANSGQYLIVGNVYKYENLRWTQTVILTRPIEQKPKLIAEEDV